MEDSGFDSEDVKMFEQDDITTHLKTSLLSDTRSEQVMNQDIFTKPTRNTALLQKKIEKRIEQMKRYHSGSSSMIEQQPRKSLIPITRLHVPSKNGPTIRDGAEQPLVMWQTDSSDDEDFELVSGDFPSPLKATSTELHKTDSALTNSLEEEEDLDLIPPHPFQPRCICCQFSTSSCTIQ